MAQSDVRRRLLCLDEHLPSCRITALRLTTRGHVCEAVSTVAAALAAIDRLKPEVVIFEWVLRDGPMPSMPALLRARASVHVPYPILLAVSTAPEPEGFCSEHRVDGYFVKPALVEHIERAFLYGRPTAITQ